MDERRSGPARQVRVGGVLVNQTAHLPGLSPGSGIQSVRMTAHDGSKRKARRAWWKWLSLRSATASLAVLVLVGCPKNDPLGQPPSAQQTAPTIAATTTAKAPAAHGSGSAAVQTKALDANGAAATSVPAEAQNSKQAARVQELIATAERTYASGVTNYRAGHLDAARHDFDAAVDGLLMSGVDVKTDAALSDEMDRLLNAVNSLEVAALKTGNGFSPAPEDAPLAAADQVTFAPNAALTAKVETQLKTTQSDLPLVVNDLVTGFINYYSNNPVGHANLLRSLERAGKYKEMIQKDLAEAGVPQDLIYLGVAESGFRPQVVNPKSGAGGMWQFMPFQGAYGLTRNGYVDERFDPAKSSKAYARYMKSLYEQFGDWYLAMAAYDWGPGYVQRAVMKTGYADYWELYRRGVLPGETKNYVPGIIAAAIMAKNPSQYGLETLHPMPLLTYDTVQTEAAVDLRLVADVTGVSVSDIVALNPSLLRATTPQDMSFDLHLPPGTKELYNDRIKEIPEEHRGSWRFHVVRPGETLDGIALSMHARVSEMAEANGLQATDAVAAGDELVIPVTPAVSARVQSYRVRRGDSLVTVADRFNVSVEQLREWNRLHANAIVPGRTLRVSEPLHLAPTGRGRSRASRMQGTRARGGKHVSPVAAARSGTARATLSRRNVPQTTRAAGSRSHHRR